MKSYLVALFFSGAVLLGGRAVAQTGKCEKTIDVMATAAVQARGGDSKIKVDMKHGLRIFLKSAKKKKVAAMPKCLISLYNEIDQDVDIYVDGNYMGSLRAHGQGVVESLDTYSQVYCVSADKEMSWTETGNCSCIYVYNLKKKKEQM